METEASAGTIHAQAAKHGGTVAWNTLAEMHGLIFA
jgi:hypothetical protein